jgi:hypothetical protein
VCFKCAATRARGERDDGWVMRPEPSHGLSEAYYTVTQGPGRERKRKRVADGAETERRRLCLRGWTQPSSDVASDRCLLEAVVFLINQLNPPRAQSESDEELSENLKRVREPGDSSKRAQGSVYSKISTSMKRE